MSPSSNSAQTGPGGLKDEGTRLQVVAAGAVSGLVSRFVIAPLDVIKIRLQLQTRSSPLPLSPSTTPFQRPGVLSTTRRILATEGIAAFWKGNIPAELLYVCYSAVQFTTYRSTTLLLRGTSSSPPSQRLLPPAAESFIAGAAAGAAGTAATYPLDLLRTRFAAQGTTRVYPSLRTALRQILRDEGVRGFYAGLGPALGQIVPYMGLFFAVYETARPACAQLNLPFGSGDATAAMATSIVAKTAVFPLDLVRKRIQVQGPTRARYVYGDTMPEYSSGAARALASILRTEGVRGLYRGLLISLVKAAPANTVTIWTYERALGVFTRMGNEQDMTM